MNLSRRLFLGGAIATVGASIVPAFASVPTIYGDGIHDDWAGIDALWRGKPARILNDAVSVRPDGLVEMVGGQFRVSKTLHMLRDGPKVHLIKTHLTWIAPVEYCIFVEAEQTFTFNGGGSVIDGSGHAVCGLHIDTPHGFANRT